jgi:cAMP phosphodiesterase
MLLYLKNKNCPNNFSSADEKNSFISANVSAHAKLRRGLIDYFVIIALFDYITKLVISSAQFGLRKFLTP